MKYKDPDYNRLLIADLYHWERDGRGKLSVKPNNEAIVL